MKSKEEIQQNKEDRYKNRKIYLSSGIYYYSPIVFKKLSDLLHHLFINSMNTYISRNEKVTYQNTGGARSREDIYIIAHTYFPNIRYAFIEDVLDKLSEAHYLSRWYCYDVCRRVHIAYSSNLTKLEEILKQNNLEYVEE